MAAKSSAHTDAVSPHNLWIPYSKIHLHAKIFVIPKLAFSVLSQSLADLHGAASNLSHPMATFPAEVEQEDILPSCSQLLL